MAELTTTSYAILALLGVQPWSTYDLARQMERSLRDIWPRAESVVYEEPKKLVAHGFAKATEKFSGRRRSTVYSITPSGRRALRRWLAQPSDAPPAFEFEAMVKVAFGDLGTHDDLLQAIDSVGKIAGERIAYIRKRLKEYEETGGPFPERLPVIALAARFLLGQAEAMKKWSTWARTEAARSLR